MKGDLAMAFRFVLPLPGFVLHPLTSVVVCVIHIYLAFGHLTPLAAGDIQWTHIWKGFGALAGAYIFAALASRGFAQDDALHQREAQSPAKRSHAAPILIPLRGWEIIADNLSKAGWSLGFQPWTLKDERPGLWTRMATESVSSCVPMKC